MRLLLSRAYLAAQRENAAHQEICLCLDEDPTCAEAYQLLGQLALHRGDPRSAEVFFREALRLDPGDREAVDALDDVQFLNQPTAAVEKLPAATVAVGCTSSAQPDQPRFLAVGSDPNLTPLPQLERRRICLTRQNRRASQSDVDAANRAGSSPPVVLAFGAYLVDRGAISRAQLDQVLAYQPATGLRIGDAAVSLGFLSRPDVERAANAYHDRG